VLELRDLVKHYRIAGGQEAVRAIDGVTLRLDSGELLALYGPSGSGKTTLLMLIAALLRPEGGLIRVNGRDIGSLSTREAARYRRFEIGFVRQSLDLIPGARTSDNAALKLYGSVGTREARRRVTPLLERLGLGERVGHRAEQLSMGERQRVMIARALSTDPGLVLADEPTGSLDTERGREVLSLLREVCRERNAAVFLVTHDPLAVRYADRVLSLQDGRITDDPPGLISAVPCEVAASGADPRLGQ
jgi:putative ABC transport system ATP-binding protein